MQVSELMSTEVVTAQPSTTLKEIARLMLNHRISGIPIVGDDEKLLGIITEADILHHEAVRAGEDHPGYMYALLGGDAGPATTAGEAMTTHVYTISPDDDHTQAARTMENRGVKRLPVVASDGSVLGVISRADIIASFARPDELIEDEIREDLIARLLWLDPDTLKITVEEGTVTLAGTVPKRTDARILEALARRLDGVIDLDASGLSYEIDDSRDGV